MAETRLNRHDLVYISQAAKAGILAALPQQYRGAALALAGTAFKPGADVPGIVRRSEGRSGEVALGFVPCGRLEGQRLRIAAFVPAGAGCGVLTPYALLRRDFAPRTPCLVEARNVQLAAAACGLTAGVLGSAALEIATGLPYTDAASDLDILLRPAPCAVLHAFYRRLRQACGVRLDFEVELPNGYGVKLAEIFMETRTLLGKSIYDVRLLAKETVMQYLT